MVWALNRRPLKKHSLLIRNLSKHWGNFFNCLIFGFRYLFPNKKCKTTLKYNKNEEYISSHRHLKQSEWKLKLYSLKSIMSIMYYLYKIFQLSIISSFHHKLFHLYIFLIFIGPAQKRNCVCAKCNAPIPHLPGSLKSMKYTPVQFQRLLWKNAV